MDEGKDNVDINYDLNIMPEFNNGARPLLNRQYTQLPQDHNRSFHDNNKTFHDNNKTFRENNKSFRDNGTGNRVWSVTASDAAPVVGEKTNKQRHFAAAAIYH